MTPVVPPPAPWMIRDRKSSSSEFAKANPTYAIPLAAIPTSNAGRRPKRSDTRPQKGALTSWATANEETRSAMTAPSPPIPSASKSLQSGPSPTNRCA